MSNNEEINKIDLMVQVENIIKAIKRLWIPMAIVIGALMSLFYLYAWVNYEPIYQSKAIFTINTKESALISGGSDGVEQIKESLPYIVNSGYMKNMVMNELGMLEFPATIELETQEVAEFYVLKVNAKEPQLSASILDSILKNCPKASVYTLGKISIEILDTSGVTSSPVNQWDKQKSLLKGALLGMAACIGIALAYSFTNRTIQKEEDLKCYLSVSCLATLPKISFKKRRKEFDKHIHIYNDKIGYAYLENVRTMRTRVQRIMEQRQAKSILVTSAIPGEGKSTVAANLALSLAEKGDRVILVDMDLRNPSVNDVLGSKFKKEDGVVEVLNGQSELKNVIRGVKKWNVHILLAGEAQSNPLALLNQKTLPKLISDLKNHYDYIIIDTPPAAMLSDTSAIAKYVDLALYVVKQDYARIERIAEGMEALNISQIPIIGVVLNGMENVIGTYSNYKYNNYRYRAYSRGSANDDGAEFVNLENPWED